MRRVPVVSALWVVVGAVAVAASGFLPWGASGRRDRTSYELVGVVDRLGILDGVAAGAVRGWYLAPLVAAGSWLAAATGHHRTSRVLAGTVALAGALFALAVRVSPVVARPGPYVTIGAASVVAAGLVLARWGRARSDG